MVPPNTFNDCLDEGFMHYYQHNIGDYRKDTLHLSLLEHGIYRQLLDSYYLDEIPLTADLNKLMRSHSIRTTDEQQALKNVLNDFFELTENGYIHTRCDAEIARYHDKSDKAKASANARWTKKNKGKHATALRTDTERNTNGMLTNNHKPITNNQNIEPKSPKGSLICPDDVESSVWHDYLKIRKAKKSPITETALNGLRREAKKADISLSDALKVCCERGWVGFKADWYSPATQKQELPLGSPEQIEYAYRVECGGDPTKARFSNYHEMRKFITDQREKRLKANA